MSQIKINDILSTNIEDLPSEVWKEIPGYKGNYLISQYSRVKSVIKKRPLILRKSLSSKKHKVVLIGKYGKLISEDVGRLCAKVFIRFPDDNEIIRFKDGNCLNTIASNLEWSTRKEIISKAPKSINVGEQNGRAIINAAKAIEIREHKKKGVSYSELSKIYNLSKWALQDIIACKVWKNV